MPDFYMPSGKSFEELKALLQGFWMEKDTDGIPVLMIKHEASLLNSIMSGCSIELVIRNPHASPRSCTLYIYDLPGNPHYTTWQEIGNPDPILKEFDAISLYLAKSKTVRVVLLNELTHPIFSTELQVNTPAISLDSWLYSVYNEPIYREVKADTDGNYFPDDILKGFPITIMNKDHSNEKTLDILSPDYEDEWRNKWEKNRGYFNLSDYKGDGKHGYLQELTIINHLGRFFIPEKEFFIGPMQLDETEFIDFILLDSVAALLIESKYVLSEKSTKRSAALKKAVLQLNKAESAILNKKASLAEKELAEKINKVEYVVKICLLNDRTILTESSDPNLINKFTKNQLPIFISVGTFFQMVATIKIGSGEFVMRSLIYSMFTNYNNYLNSPLKICYIRDFSTIKSEM